MAERTAILIDRNGDVVGTASNPLYVGGFAVVGSFVDLTDVAVASPASGDYIGYDAATGKYVNKPVSGTGMGDVTGPTGATAGHFPVFDSSGKILYDSGYAPASFGDVHGPSSSTDRAIAGFSGAGGKTLISMSPTVSLAGVLDMKGQKVIGVAPPDDSGDVATKLYVDQFIQGVAWQMPVISILAASPASPVDEARYIVADTAAGDWIGHEDSIATWWAAGNDWVYAAPGDGWAAYNQNTSTIWVYNLSLGHWVDIGTSGIPEAPSNGTPYARQDGGWLSTQVKLFDQNILNQITPLPVPTTVDTFKLCDAHDGGHPYYFEGSAVTVYVPPGAVVTLRSAAATWMVDDTFELHAPNGVYINAQSTVYIGPVDVTAYFNSGANTCHIITFSTAPSQSHNDEMYLYVTPGGTRDIVPRIPGTGFLGVLTNYWNSVFANTITAISGFKVGADALSYLHVGAAAANHVHPLATQVASGFMPQLNGNVASYLVGDGTWAPGGTPAAHASTHLSTGVDPILPASPAGYSGLLTGSDKSKLDGIAAGAQVNVNADWNASVGVASILNKPVIPASYTLPVASATQLGGVKIGANVTVSADGTISVSAGGGSGGQYLVQRAIEGVVYETTAMYWVAPASCTVASATMSLVSTGALCKVQVMKNGILETNSIFASDVAMQVASTDTPVNGVYQSNGTLDAAQVALAKGDRVEFRVNQADTGCADLLIQLRCTIT